MNKIKALPISECDFSDFGCYYDYLNPTGNTLGTFFHDHIKYAVSGNMPVGFSAMVTKKPEKIIISAVEYHNTTAEIIMPLDDDIIIHCAPPSKAPCPEKTKAFIVPKGTAVKLDVGVWHKAPCPKNNEEVHMLIVLPERTYFTDCNVVEYSDEQMIEITY